MEGAAIESTSEGWSGEDSSASSIQSTLWSVILRTRDPKDPHRIAALVRLSAQYSMALYAYVRSRHVPTEDAQASVLGFFAYLRAGRLSDGSGALPDRLRTFLLRGFEEYLDRGPHPGKPPDSKRSNTPLSLDFPAAESWYQAESSKANAPEVQFHRAWARCILSQSHAVLKGELAATYGDEAAEVITAEVSPLERRPFNAELAPRLNLTPSEVLEALRSTRRRLRDLIHATLRETVSSSSDVEVEFWDLFKSI